MLQFDRFDALSFDCYGTLIDWETGILGALRPVLARHGVACEDDRLLALYARAETAAEAGAYLPYREVLRSAMTQIGSDLGFRPNEDETRSLADSLPDWPPFGDTTGALLRLRSRFRLAIASNIDDDLFEATRRRLGVEFDLVTTAQQVRSYKPAPAHFKRTIEGLGIPKERLLHTAQSLFHDIAPARALGLSTVWVNRRSGKTGPGATPPADARPDLVVPDLKSLADLAGCA